MRDGIRMEVDTQVHRLAPRIAGKRLHERRHAPAHITAQLIRVTRRLNGQRVDRHEVRGAADVPFTGGSSERFRLRSGVRERLATGREPSHLPSFEPWFAGMLGDSVRSAIAAEAREQTIRPRRITERLQGDQAVLSGLIYDAGANCQHEAERGGPQFTAAWPSRMAVTTVFSRTNTSTPYRPSSGPPLSPTGPARLLAWRGARLRSGGRSVVRAPKMPALR